MLTYLLIGEDTAAKDAKISEIKEKILTTPDARNFDLENLSAHKLEPKALKEILISLPAVAPKRLIIIRECHKFSPYNKELILEFAAKKADYAVLVLESGEWQTDDAVVKKLKGLPSVKALEFFQPRLNVFDLTKAIGAQRPIDSLKILTNLLDQGEHPLQLMGGLVWFWGKSRGKISSDQFKKGLLALQEADLNIKRSRLEPDEAMEVLVVKLSSPQAG